MQTNRWKKRAAIIAACAATAALVPSLAAPSASAQTDPSIGPGGEYFPVEPTRLLDTRDPALDVAPTGPKPADANGETFRLQVTGVGGVPETGVLAVAVNVVAFDPSTGGFVSVRPAGFSPSPGALATSLLNFSSPGEFSPNLGIVGVGTNGEIEFEVVTQQPSSIQMIVDIYGWIASSSYDDADDEGGRIRSVEPVRFMDTRNASQLPPALSSPRLL
ncbi:MAG: hypothetical protein AAGG08_05450, partial [Actinomycetota bacterium]